MYEESCFFNQIIKAGEAAMNVPLSAPHGIRYSVDDHADQNRLSGESIFHRIWVTFLFVAFLLVVLIFL